MKRYFMGTAADSYVGSFRGELSGSGSFLRGSLTGLQCGGVFRIQDVGVSHKDVLQDFKGARGVTTSHGLGSSLSP